MYYEVEIEDREEFISRLKQEDVDKVLQDVRDRKKDAAWRKPRKKSETKRDCITPKD